MRKPLVYVAGPITGNPWGCVRQATDAFAILRGYGLVPFLPQLSVLHEMVDPQPYNDWLAYDLDVILNCDALVRLPGASKGADAEVSYALGLGLPVFQIVGEGDWRAIGSWAARKASPNARLEAARVSSPNAAQETP